MCASEGAGLSSGLLGRSYPYNRISKYIHVVVLDLVVFAEYCKIWEGSQF